MVLNPATFVRADVALISAVALFPTNVALMPAVALLLNDVAALLNGDV